MSMSCVRASCGRRFAGGRSGVLFVDDGADGRADDETAAVDEPASRFASRREDRFPRADPLEETEAASLSCSCTDAYAHRLALTTFPQQRSRATKSARARG
eukprot:654974-Prymnesium_polylepis.1